jgi:hypothetical protein
LQDSKAIIHDVVIETLQDNLNNAQVTHHSDKRYGYFLQLSDIHVSHLIKKNAVGLF